MEENDILSSVAYVFDKSEENQGDCKNGLLFLEKMAAAGYEEPAQIIIDCLRPVDTIEGAWFLTTAVALDLGNATRLLIKAGACVDRDYHYGFTPLMHAVQLEQIECVQSLLNAGANVKENNKSVVFMAVFNNRADILKLVIEAGASFEKVGVAGTFEENMTPLHVAAMVHATDCVRLLIELGANVNATTADERKTPLHWSACTDMEIWERICEVPEESRTIWLYNYIRDMSMQLDFMRALVDAGADTGSVCGRGRTALHYAADDRSPEALKFLVQSGTPLEHRDKNGDTALHVAVRFHGCDSRVCLECMKVLIHAGSDTEATTPCGRLPLDLLVEARDRMMVSRNFKTQDIMMFKMKFQTKPSYKLMEVIEQMEEMLNPK